MTVSTNVGRARLRARRGILVVSTVLCSGLVAPAFAQTAAPPVQQIVDDNGVDLFLGMLNVKSPTISMGQKDAGMSYRYRRSQQNGWVDNITAYIDRDSPQKLTVVIDDESHSFSLSSGQFTSLEGDGSSLSLSGTMYTFTSSDGTVIHFDHNIIMSQPFGGTEANVVDIHYTSGNTINYTWQSAGTVHRIERVSSSFGYVLSLKYESDQDPSVSGFQWQIKRGADLTNTTTSASTSLSLSQKGLSQSETENDFDDAMGREVKYIWNFNGLITKIIYPGSTVPDVNISYPNSYTNQVTSIAKASGTTSYSYADANGVRTTTVTDQLGHVAVYTFDIAAQRMTSVKDPVGNITRYQYDNFGRIAQITYPEGNVKKYTYDARGNIIEARDVSKTPGTPPDSVSSAGYIASCTAVATCNKPQWTRDPAGNQTDYTYDANTGNLLTAQAPAAVNGGPRPTITNSYTTVSGVQLLSGSSTCSTAASCPGTANETKTAITYNGIGLPIAVTKQAGDGTVVSTTTTTYNSVGDIASTDGPLPGDADSTIYRYDADREVVGVIGPDPDASGPRNRKATRISYDPKGRVTIGEIGTVADASDAAWNAFSSQQQLAITYDGVDRPLTKTLTAGGVTYSSTQIGYDHQRLDHVTLLMNGDGPDRTTKYSYDDADRRTKITVALGTSDQSDDTTIGYTPNGQQASVTDANGNVTSYGYDGFDRVSTTTYSGGSYEQLGYDANGNVTSRRLRDGTSIGYIYDALNRPITKTLPDATGINSIAYSYDLLGRQTGALGNGWMNNTFSYDALGRMIADNKYDGGLTYAYDAAGRRTRMTWPDGFYATYDYDTIGNVTAIKENGSAVLASYGYDDLGRRTSLSRGNGVVTTYGYDAVSRLSGLTLDLAGTANDQVVLFGYSPAGQISSRTASNDTYAWTAAVNVDRNYTTNGLNQYTAAGGVSFGYDGRGNLTSSGSTTYAYTSENRLSTVGGNTLAYEPAGGELLQYYLSSGVDTRFITSGGQIVEEINASPWQMTKRYVLGPGDDEPLVEYDASGNKTWLVADERGSIVARTDASGNATTINRYDEFGIPASGNQGRFQYTGQAYLSEIGLYYYKARIYSPTLGRFLQTDPIGYGDGLNWYNYAGSDPVNGADSFGTETQRPVYTGSILGGVVPGFLSINGVSADSILVNLNNFQWDSGGSDPATPEEALNYIIEHGGYSQLDGGGGSHWVRVGGYSDDGGFGSSNGLTAQSSDPQSGAPCLPGESCKLLQPQQQNCNLTNNFCGPEPKVTLSKPRKPLLTPPQRAFVCDAVGFVGGGVLANVAGEAVGELTTPVGGAVAAGFTGFLSGESITAICKG